MTWPLAAALLAACLYGGAAAAGKPPRVDQVVEGRRIGDHRPVLRLEGKGLKRAASARLLTPEGAEAGVLQILQASNRTATLLLPEGPEPGEYDLEVTMAKGESFAWRVSLKAGGILPGSVEDRALDPGLRYELDDADRLAGEEAAFYLDAGNLDAGTLPPVRFSSLADLLEEGWISEEGRIEPLLLSAREDLEAEGHLDGAGLFRTDRFSAWSDFVAEGVVDGSGILATGAFSAWKDLGAEGHLDGDGHLRVEDYSAWADLEAEGKVDGSGRLRTDFFTAYGSLNASGKFGPGASQVAAGEHAHAGSYIEETGGTISGRLLGTGLKAGDLVLYGVGWGNPADIEMLRADFLGTDVLGYGLWVVKVTDALGDGGEALKAVGDEVSGFAAIQGTAKSASGIGIGVVRTSSVSGEPVCVTGGGLPGTIELLGLNEGGGTGIHAECTGTAEPVLEVDIAPSSANRASSAMALFTAGTTDVARIDVDGKGWFDGGIQTGGADFAERVRVDRPEGAFEPGDVLVIDPEAERGFSLSAGRASPLVAGVVSARPGVVGGQGPAEGAAGGGDARVTMAILGILPVKVCDEGGPIEAGDLLVTAALPGHACRAPERPGTGTVLGRALGRLPSGRGSVEVLLRLR